MLQPKLFPGSTFSSQSPGPLLITRSDKSRAGSGTGSKLCSLSQGAVKNMTNTGDLGANLYTVCCTMGSVGGHGQNASGIKVQMPRAAFIY